MLVSTPCMSLVFTETKTGCWIPWNWCYRQLWASMWELGTKVGLSARAASTLYLWDTSQPLNRNSFKCKILHVSFSTYSGFSIWIRNWKSTICEGTGKQRNDNASDLFGTSCSVTLFLDALSCLYDNLRKWVLLLFQFYNSERWNGGGKG